MIVCPQCHESNKNSLQSILFFSPMKAFTVLEALIIFKWKSGKVEKEKMYIGEGKLN